VQAEASGLRHQTARSDPGSAGSDSDGAAASDAGCGSGAGSEAGSGAGSASEADEEEEAEDSDEEYAYEDDDDMAGGSGDGAGGALVDQEWYREHQLKRRYTRLRHMDQTPFLLLLPRLILIVFLKTFKKNHTHTHQVTRVRRHFFVFLSPVSGVGVPHLLTRLWTCSA
jgi:hypothetical protein